MAKLYWDFSQQFWNISRKKLYFDISKIQENSETYLEPAFCHNSLWLSTCNYLCKKFWISFWNLRTAEDFDGQNVTFYLYIIFLGLGPF